MFPVHSMAHVVRYFPYRFRMVGVLAAGAVGGSLSVFTQKAYYNKWIKPAPVVTIVPEPLSGATSAAAAVTALPPAVMEDAKPVHTPKSVLPVQSAPKIEGTCPASTASPRIRLRSLSCYTVLAVAPEVLPADIPPTTTLFDRVRRLADRESLKNSLPEVVTDLSAYRYKVVDPVVSLDVSAGASEVVPHPTQQPLPPFKFEVNVAEALKHE